MQCCTCLKTPFEDFTHFFSWVFHQNLSANTISHMFKSKIRFTLVFQNIMVTKPGVVSLYPSVAKGGNRTPMELDNICKAERTERCHLEV